MGEEDEQCIHLNGATPGDYVCGIHDFIVEQPNAGCSPAFGGGCSSSMFNMDRNTAIRLAVDTRRTKDEPM
jgi:hypothetical protein